MSSCVPTAELDVTRRRRSPACPASRLLKSVNLNVAKLRELMTHEPSAMPIFCLDSPPVPVVPPRARAEQVAGVGALRVAIAGVEQDGARRREGQLAEVLVALLLVLGQLAVVVGAVVALHVGPVVRAVEEELARKDRSADVDGDPVAILLVARAAAVVESAPSCWRLELEADLAGERFVPDLLTESIVKPPERSKSTARAPPWIIVTCAMSCVEGSADERAEQRQRHVDAVELVDVVLAAAAGARSADGVLRVLHAGDQLLQIAVLLADRQALICVARQAALDGRRLLVDQRRRRRDVDGLRSRPDAERGVDGRVLRRAGPRPAA